MLGGVERIVERPAALWTRLNGHAQSQRIVGDGRAPGQYRAQQPHPTNADSARLRTALAAQAVARRSSSSVIPAIEPLTDRAALAGLSPGRGGGRWRRPRPG